MYMDISFFEEEIEIYNSKLSLLNWLKEEAESLPNKIWEKLPLNL